MDVEKIREGKIMKCIKYERRWGYCSIKDDIYIKDALLVKTKDGLFIDVENLNMFRIMRLYLEDIKRINCGGPYMAKHGFGTYLGELYVENTMRYTPEDKSERVSLMKLRKEHCKKQ